MYYDSHTHLNSDQLYPQWKEHLQNFFQAGGHSLVNIGVNDERNRRAITIAKEAPKIINQLHFHKANSPSLKTRGWGEDFIAATIGLHPGEISNGTISSKEQIDEELDKLQTLYAQNPDYIVGIGECGIDSHYERNEQIQKLQSYAFDQQCQLADQLKLPLIIHSRDNFPLTLDIIKTYPQLKVYFHCRGYGPNEVIQAHEKLPQLRIGFCGNLSYPKAQLLRDSFQKVVETSNLLSSAPAPQQNPIHLLLETDAPYLAPQKKRGQQNLPAYIIDLYDYVSEQRHIPGATLQTYLQASFYGLYQTN